MKSFKAVSGLIGVWIFFHKDLLSGEAFFGFILEVEFLTLAGMCSLKACLCFVLSFNNAELGEINLLITGLDFDDKVRDGLNFIKEDFGVINDPVCLCLGVCSTNFSFFGLSGEFEFELAEMAGLSILIMINLDF